MCECAHVLMSRKVLEGRNSDSNHVEDMKSLLLVFFYILNTVLILLPSWGVSVFIKINLLS